MSGASSRLRLLARALCAVFALLVVATVILLTVLELDSSYVPAQSLPDSVPNIITTLSFLVVGAIVTLKRPDNLVGWALSLAGFGQLLGGVIALYAELALLAKPEAGLPAGDAAAAIAGSLWVPLMVGVFLLLVVFPVGQFPSPRWRRTSWFVVGAFGLVGVLISTGPGELDPPFQAFANPLALTDSRGYIAIVFVLVGVCLAFVAAAAGHLLRRFRRSRGPERQQFKWFAASAGLLLLAQPFAAIFNYSGVASIPFGIAIVALPVSVGIAVLRYRLYEIDLIIRRTLVYGAVTAALAALYFGIVLALQQVFSGFAGGSDLAIAGSTLAVAALFRPVRNRVQAFVDRRFYRRKYDAQRTLETFSTRLRARPTSTRSTRSCSRSSTTMQPAHVSALAPPAGGRAVRGRIAWSLFGLSVVPAAGAARVVDGHPLARGRPGPRGGRRWARSSRSSPTRLLAR